MESCAVLPEVISFVEKIRGNHSFPLSGKTTLEKDLRMTGDDAYEFMAAFFDEFSIDPTGFDSTVYFYPEGLDLIGLSFLVRKIAGLPPLTRPVYDITLADLSKAVLTRTWPKLI